ncbi:peptide ABC transporter ATP-binding protein [Phyllobacterium brassicacearum]|uniref:Peptide ABC transporter ATP-binding protein n=1 Tax=Phyllobacterium brassicacearum TaxID=314235 RepID=A0A2P7B411_9HYPH|nr:ABC transporter ATP-binding protein [Phyllobacterium brassicacearum]PSH61191.1 peptide ABC transporter ATP-binding protein [Phyllobacterium brassicacearum]TDQ12879.1 peptide/nickel transport system ATP-binding protein [Phyllobacterium brassicacearum]
MDNPLLSVRDLRISFHGAAGVFDAVRGVSFDLGREKLGIVGESGSGKSMTGRAIMRLSPPAAIVRAEHIRLGDIDILQASERTMDAIRGRRIGLIMQDPKYSLNPVVTVGEQIAEAYRIHARSSVSDARQRAVAMLGAVQIRDPERVYRMYPHEMSGGMGQRIMIAMMLVSEPEILIADEATSALDVTVRLEILNLLNDLVEKRGLGLIFISHDLNLVRRFCDRVLIMYRGRVVETLKAGELDQATHPYTRGLLEAMPRIHVPRKRLPVLKRDAAW